MVYAIKSKRFTYVYRFNEKINNLMMSATVHCLLIDDDKDDQEIFMLALESMSSWVKGIFANSAKEALNILESAGNLLPDFIFLDLNMPGINGKQCLVELKKIKQVQHIPVYIYSTSSDPRDKIITKELGATGFISKHYSIEELSNELLKVFNISRVTK